MNADGVALEGAQLGCEGASVWLGPDRRAVGVVGVTE